VLKHLKEDWEFDKGVVYNDEKFMMNLPGIQNPLIIIAIMDNGYLQARMETKNKKRCQLISRCRNS
jgi:hypothetical protein